MCTAVFNNKKQKKHLFGRTLDVECSLGEKVIITPRAFRINTRYGQNTEEHFAIIGIGIVSDGVPLYYDAMNEHGLCAAALNFPISAAYNEPRHGYLNLASFELIPYVLATCRDLSEARKMLEHANITNDSFSGELLATPMHWMISDKCGSIVAEPREGRLEIHENSYGVLTNEPPFEQQCFFLADHMGLCVSDPPNLICPTSNIKPYSNGMGAMGLPGDFSSRSRFVRAVFLNEHATPHAEDPLKITEFFSIMDSVSIPCGVVKNLRGRDHFTLYTSCADMDGLIYYFSTCKSGSIYAVKLSAELADAHGLALADMDLAQSPQMILPKIQS